MRQTEGSVVCNGCGRLADVREKNCPNCGQWRPGLYGYSATLQSLTAGIDVTQLIVFACGFLFILALAADIRAIMKPQFGFFSFLSPSGRANYLLGLTSGRSPWYTNFSAIFLHGGILHIYFNMMWTRSLGPLVEDGFGPARYFTLFVLSGVAGFVLSNMLSGAPTIGASGAVFGLLAAAIVYGKQRGGSFGDAVQRQSWGYAIALMALGFLWPGGGINNWAHLGGFAGGFVLARVQIARAQRPESPVEQLLAVVLALISIGAVVASVFLNFRQVYNL
jgi:rhomboid protease GluP